MRRAHDSIFVRCICDREKNRNLEPPSSSNLGGFAGNALFYNMTSLSANRLSKNEKRYVAIYAELHDTFAS